MAYLPKSHIDRFPGQFMYRSHPVEDATYRCAMAQRHIASYALCVAIWVNRAFSLAPCRNDAHGCRTFPRYDCSSATLKLNYSILARATRAAEDSKFGPPDPRPFWRPVSTSRAYERPVGSESIGTSDLTACSLCFDLDPWTPIRSLTIGLIRLYSSVK